MQRLLALTHESTQAQEMLKGDYWQKMPAQAFSFAIAGLISLPPEISQALLEMINPQERLDYMLSVLNQAGPAISS